MDGWIYVNIGAWEEEEEERGSWLPRRIHSIDYYVDSSIDSCCLRSRMWFSLRISIVCDYYYRWTFSHCVYLCISCMWGLTLIQHCCSVPHCLIYLLWLGRFPVRIDSFRRVRCNHCRSAGELLWPWENMIIRTCITNEPGHVWVMKLLLLISRMALICLFFWLTIR